MDTVERPAKAVAAKHSGGRGTRWVQRSGFCVTTRGLDSCFAPRNSRCGLDRRRQGSATEPTRSVDGSSGLPPASRSHNAALATDWSSLSPRHQHLAVVCCQRLGPRRRIAAIAGTGQCDALRPPWSALSNVPWVDGSRCRRDRCGAVGIGRGGPVPAKHWPGRRPRRRSAEHCWRCHFGICIHSLCASGRRRNEPARCRRRAVGLEASAHAAIRAHMPIYGREVSARRRSREPGPGLNGTYD